MRFPMYTVAVEQVFEMTQILPHEVLKAGSGVDFSVILQSPKVIISESYSLGDYIRGPFSQNPKC